MSLCTHSEPELIPSAWSRLRNRSRGPTTATQGRPLPYPAAVRRPRQGDSASRGGRAPTPAWRRARGGDELGQRLREVLTQLLDVGHRVVVAEQAEVDA